MPLHSFSTAFGRCGLVWQDELITGFLLPGDTYAGRGSGAEETLPPHFAALVAQVVAHLAGELHHFRALPLDWERVTPFQAQVLQATVEIPPGQALTYGELAARLGAKPGAARAIGGALGSNPWPLLVPCHRVVGAGGKLTGFSSRGGVELKARLLALEGYAWA